MKIVSYVEMKADKFKAKIGNPQLELDLSKEFNAEQYSLIEEFKKNNPHVVKCIPLDDINSLSLTEKLPNDQLEILYESGFVLNGIDKYGNDFYIRKELLQ
jgi:hypothetical protein